HRRLDHRPQCARNAGADRPLLHHLFRRGADGGPPGRHRQRPAGARPLPRRGFQDLTLSGRLSFRGAGASAREPGIQSSTRIVYWIPGSPPLAAPRNDAARTFRGNWASFNDSRIALYTRGLEPDKQESDQITRRTLTIGHGAFPTT